MSIKCILTGQKDMSIKQCIIPKGRMRGDVDGDGKVTGGTTDETTDVGLVFLHSNTTQMITDEIALWCADVNIDGEADLYDAVQINRYLAGLGSILTSSPTFADYYNNWTYEKIDNLTGRWYADISVSGVTSSNTAIVTIDQSYKDNIFSKVECGEGYVRIYVTRCPIVDIPCTISIGTSGSSLIISDNAEDVANTLVSEHASDTDIHVTEEEKETWNAKMDAPFKPTGKSYLTFSSPSSFTLAVNNATKNWDGTLEYFSSDKTWTTWDGTTTLSSVENDEEHVLYLRGTGNTIITGSSSDYRWVLNGSNISCIGNIEILLDYATVESGEHPAMGNNCYSRMFSDCTSLIQAPALPATTLANQCYNSMFKDCTSLTKAPALPATTLADYCYYYMFSGCTSLTQAPTLPAITVDNGSYNCMFYGCTSLTQAPALPATTLSSNCYEYMFQGCISLIQAPALPATTLANYCYSRMFSNCTSLTQAPALPATTLANACYFQMFYRCSNIKFSSTQTDEYTQGYRIPTSGTGTTATDALTNMFTNTGGTFKGTPDINTTYYLSSDNDIVYNYYVYEEGAGDDKYTPKKLAITLSASLWDATSLTQEVTIMGIKADETAQLITPTPAIASQSSYYDAGILCTAQAENSLTFTCKTVPTEDLTVYVTIQEVQ